MNKMRIIPTKEQWKKWTLPSKATYISVWIGAISLLSFIVVQTRSRGITEEHSGDIHQAVTGNDNVQVATTGDNSPIIIDNRKESRKHIVKGNRLSKSQPEGKFFVTKYKFYSDHHIPYVSFTVFADTIVDCQIISLTTAIMTRGSRRGKQEDGSWHESIFGFSGKYLMSIKTTRPEDIEIKIQ